VDTSYEVPQLRLQLPRDVYTRKVFPKDFITKLLERIGKIGGGLGTIPLYPDQTAVFYFLKYYKKFYSDPTIKRFLKERNPNKVELSNAIAKFLRIGLIDQLNDDELEWWFKRKYEPDENFIDYLCPKYKNRKQPYFYLE